MYPAYLTARPARPVLPVGSPSRRVAIRSPFRPCITTLHPVLALIVDSRSRASSSHSQPSLSALPPPSLHLSLPPLSLSFFFVFLYRFWLAESGYTMHTRMMKSRLQSSHDNPKKAVPNPLTFPKHDAWDKRDLLCELSHRSMQDYCE